MVEIDEEHLAAFAGIGCHPRHQCPCPGLSLAVTGPVDRDNSIWSVRQGNLIKQHIAFRIDHGNVGRDRWHGGGVSSIGEVVPAFLGIDPTDVKTHQSAGNGDCGQKSVGAELVFAFALV